MTRNYAVIDADAHVLEPGDLWSNYLEARFKDKAPRLVTLPDGREVFRVDDFATVDVGKSTASAFAYSGGIGMREGNGPRGTSYYDGAPGGFDPHLRIPHMDAEGIDAAFLYPTLALFNGGIRDGAMASAACRAYNRWLADYCSLYPDRLFGVAMLPMQSVQDAVAEIEFAVNTLGFRGGFLRPNPYLNRPLHHPDNYPVWAAAEAHDFSIGLHANSSKVGMEILGENRFTEGFAVKHCTFHVFEMMAAVASFVMCGICERYPRLRVGFLESSGGWVSGFIDRMDRHYDDKGMNDMQLSARPSDIFKRQCFIAFEPVEKTLALVAEHIGRTNVLWASDYPHGDGFTDAPGLIRKLGMPPDLEKDVFAAGAKRFYKMG